MKNRGLIDLVNKQTREEYRFDLNSLKATRGFCPGCHYRRSDKRNRAFRWNAEKGYGFCYYCNTVFYDKDREAYNPGHNGGARICQPRPSAPERVATTEVVEVEFIL